MIVMANLGKLMNEERVDAANPRTEAGLLSCLLSIHVHFLSSLPSYFQFFCYFLYKLC